MEQAEGSPGLNNECFLTALREEDFLSSLCQKSSSKNGKFSRELNSDTSSDVAVPPISKSPTVPQKHVHDYMSHTDDQRSEIQSDSSATGSMSNSVQDELFSNQSAVYGRNSAKNDDVSLTCSPQKVRRTSSTLPQSASCPGSAKLPRKPISRSSSSTGSESNIDLRKVRIHSETESSMSDFSDKVDAKKKRYNKTQEALRGSGLLEITMKTADLIKQNRRLQKEIEDFKREASLFMQDVLSNPENKHLKEALQPGSKVSEDATVSNNS